MWLERVWGIQQSCSSFLSMELVKHPQWDGPFECPWWLARIAVVSPQVLWPSSQVWCDLLSRICDWLWTVQGILTMKMIWFELKRRDTQPTQSVTRIALRGSKPHTMSVVSGEAQWCVSGSHLDLTFSRAELQENPIGQTYPWEEGHSQAVICQRTEKGSPAVISWGLEQILKYLQEW